MSSQFAGARARPVARCRECGKGCYPSRKQARSAARRNHPGEHKQAYRCAADPRYWHYGRLDYASLRGFRGQAPRANRPGIPAVLANTVIDSPRSRQEVGRDGMDRLSA